MNFAQEHARVQSMQKRFAPLGASSKMLRPNDLSCSPCSGQAAQLADNVTTAQESNRARPHQHIQHKEQVSP